MEAKDTVMRDRELLKFELKYSRGDDFYWGAAFDAAIKAQAEISFKAGQKSRDSEIRELRIEVGGIAFEKGKKAGRREVVEWIKPYRCNNPEDMAHSWILVPPDEWQAQLKEWFKNNPELLKEWGLIDE